MTAPTPAQPSAERLPDSARARLDEDLSSLHAAYAALNDRNHTPIVDLLDPQVHLRGPEHGHLWWQTHRTWNGPGEVCAELARRGFSPDPLVSQIEARVGSPTPIGTHYIVKCRITRPGTTPSEPDRHVDFHEVVTMRAGKIVRLADYRSQQAAHSAAAATW